LTQTELIRDAECDLIGIDRYGIEQFGQAQAERCAMALSTHIAFIVDNSSLWSDYSTVRDGLRPEAPDLP